MAKGLIAGLVAISWAAVQPSPTYAGLLGPADACQCTLEGVQDVNNTIAARYVMAGCFRSFGSGCKKRSLSWFGTDSPKTCFDKYGKSVKSSGIAQIVGEMCVAVYGPRLRINP